MLNYFLEYNRYLNIVGIFVTLGIAWAFSRQRKKINYRLILNALITLFVVALIVIKTQAGSDAISWVASGVAALYAYTGEGAKFLFGSLTDPTGSWGSIFAFRVLPVIVFFGALISLLLYLRVIQFITKPISVLLYRIFGTSAAETLCAVANSFLGQTEAPILIKHYLNKLTRSELLTVMVAGMGTTSAPLFILYATLGAPIKYILSATIMAIPATILIAKILLPETEEPATKNGLHKVDGEDSKNIFEAIAEGTWSGLQIALAVGAMLIAFIALIALINSLLGWIALGVAKLLALFGVIVNFPPITFQSILGVIFAPIAWLFGLTGDEILKAGQLLGTKLAINEVIAYSSLSALHLSERAIALLSFALCGFANFSSIGIQIAGIGAIAPDQRKRLSELGLIAVLGGTLANLLSAFVAGLML